MSLGDGIAWGCFWLAAGIVVASILVCSVWANK